MNEKRNRMFGAVLLLLLGFQTAIMADSLSVNIFSISIHHQTNSVSFGLVNIYTQYKLSREYLQVKFSNSMPSDWMIQISTRNSNATSPGGQYGGLIGDVNNRSTRQPLLWRVYTNTNGNILCTNSQGWAKVKDTRDSDWSSRFSDRLVASNGYLANYPSYGLSAVSPFYLYLGANFTNKIAGNYDTTLYLDILPFSLSALAPGINYEPLSEINIIGDKILFYADLADDDIISTVNFYHRNHLSSSFNVSSSSPGSQNYHLQAEVPLAEVTMDGVDFYIQAIDLSGNQTNTRTNFITVNPSVTKTIGVAGGEIGLVDGNSQDGKVLLTVPANSLDGNKSITFKQIFKPENYKQGTEIVLGQTPLMEFEITPNVKLEKASRLDLLYFDLNNNGKPEDVNGLETDLDEKKLCIFWWDGYEWRYVGGTVDSVKNTVSAYVTHFGLFGIFSVPNLDREAFRPKERIITPNGDGMNDTCNFGGMPESVEINIFDVNGRLIRKIDDKPEWDGKDKQGRVVESGVYIYQAMVPINGKKERISGSIGIAK